MEALRQDDPRRIGPYTVLSRLRETASAVQYLAHDSGGSAAVVAVARPELASLPAFRRRFEAEAQTAERLAGGWVQAPLTSRTDGWDGADASDSSNGSDGAGNSAASNGADNPDGSNGSASSAASNGADSSGSDGSGLWTATAYVPALTLAEAVALAGPLPERTVRILGAALAETLSRVHATGAVLHGLAADTVLLASDGPRLTAFGALGAAAAAEAGPGGQLSVRLGYLTPEQLAGQEPGPASDIFVLGLLLVYAATGATPWAAGPQDAAADRIAHAEPELAAVPAELRELIAGCLAKSPADRPTPGALAAELALEGAAALARAGWLPSPLTTALADQAARTREPAAPSRCDISRLHRVGDSAQDPGPQTPDGLKDSTEPAVIHARRTTTAPGPDPSATEPNQARPAIEDTPGGRPGAWGPAPSYGKGRVGESAAGPIDAADVDSGLTRRLRAPRRTVPPAPNGGVPQPTTTATPALTHPATALTLPPATVLLTAPPQPPTQTRPGPGTGPAAAPDTGTTSTRTRSRSTTLTRRDLFAGIAAGAAGLLVGGSGMLALAGGDDDTPPRRTTDDAKPAARRKPLPGIAPAPLWHYQHPAEPAADGPPAHIWRDQVLLIPTPELMTALDLRTGRRLWEQKAAGTMFAPEAADDTHCFVITPTDFLWLSAKDGQTKHRTPYGPLLAKDRQDTRVTLGAKTAADGPVVWFSGKIETFGGRKDSEKDKSEDKADDKADDKVTRTRTYLFAYDMAARKELWRTEMPNGRPGPVPVPTYEAVGIRRSSLLLRQDTASLTAAQTKKAKGRSAFILIDRRTGKTLWRKFFPGVRPDAGVTDGPSGRLFAAVDGGLHAYGTRSGRKLWQLKDAHGPSDDAPFGFGRGVVRGKELYVANGFNEVYAVDVSSGTQRWKRATEYPGRATPQVTLSGSGRTLLALNETQATAIGARDGRRLWKFQDAGVTAPGDAEATTAPYRAQTSGSTAVLWRGRNFYALPLD